MTVVATKAALLVAEKGSELTSHQLISLLMEGILERVFQTKIAIDKGNEEDKSVLIDKIVAILNGLRSSLNVPAGGKIALNLESLYVYMIERIYSATSVDEQKEVMDEVGKLVQEVKSGWDEMLPTEEHLTA